MARRDPFATAALRHMPVQSAMPGTTLGPIEIDAFSGGGSLFDTPGIHVHHRMAAVVSPEDLTLLAPHRRLRGYPVPPSISERIQKMSGVVEIREGYRLPSHAKDDEVSDQDSYSDSESNSLGTISEEGVSVNGSASSLSGASIIWGGLVRLDVIKAPANAGFRLYGPNAIRIFTVPTLKADSFYKEELGKRLTPPTNAKDWQGLQSEHTLKVTLQSFQRPACDISISGLGWVTIEVDHAAFNAKLEEEMTDESEREVELKVFVPKAVEVFVRPPLPVGLQGSEWYDYRELTEQELQTRPRIFH